MTTCDIRGHYGKRSTHDGRDTPGGHGGAVGAVEGPRRRQGGRGGAPRAAAKVIQLPLWPEPKRGAPNAVLRGALFAAIQGKDRRQSGLSEQLIAALRTVSRYPLYRGSQLDQADLDVWEQALHLAPDAGPRHGVPFHRERLSQGAGPIRPARVNHDLAANRPSRTADRSHRRAYLKRPRGPTAVRLVSFGARDEDTGRYCPGDQPQARASFFSPLAVGHRSTGSSASSYVASPWRYGCTASMPATPRPHPLSVEPTCTSSAAARPSSSANSSKI